MAAWTLALVVAWLAVNPHTPDLAAQVYRASLFRELGFTVWDDNWYAGHSLPAYSLIYPPLGSWLGVRAVGALSVCASSALFALLVRRFYGERACWGAALFALAAVGDVWSGRVTFALGVSFALAAALALARGRPWWAALLALASTAASPVAGALVGLAGLSCALAHRSPRALIVLAGPGAALVAVLVALFGEGGYEPYPLLSFLATVAAVGMFVVALPRDATLLRSGAVVYLLACVACLVVHTPIGSNVERYGVLLAGPLLLCALLGERPQGAQVGAAALRGGRVRGGGEGGGRGALTPLGALALCAISVWVVWGPVRETLAVVGSPATSASYYKPLERFLARVGAPPAEPVRVEVPLTRSHWEAALLAPRVALARGWDKQLEERYDGVLLRPGLSAASYERWLHEQAVGYVALPDVPLDPSSAREGRLIRAGLPYLRLVFTSAHWRVYRVLGATPIASGPGSLTALAHDSFTLHARAAGSFLVRVHYTRYWTLARGSGCVGSAPGGWTRVRAGAPGMVVVSASFSLARALGGGEACTAGAHALATRDSW